MAGSLAFTKDKNQVATPWHIVEFLSELLQTENKTVFDPTAGSGAMFSHCGRAVGIEYDFKAYSILKENVPHGEFVNASLFDSEEWIKQQNIDVVLMNPPFNCSKSIMPDVYKKKYGEKGADSTKGLYFVKYVADIIGRGTLAAIIPSGAIQNGNKAIKETKEEILRNHTLKAVLKLNGDLFYPAVSVGVECIILDLGTPNNGRTWFADFSEDGLIKDRTQGRIDKEGKWEDIKRKWIELYEVKPTHQIGNKGGYIPCEYKETTAQESWSALSNIGMNEELLSPTVEDFRKTVKDYMEWRIKTDGLKKFLKDNPHLRPSPQERLKRAKEQMEQLQKEIQELENEIKENTF